MFVEWGEAADRPASPKGRERPRLCENAPSRDLLRIFFLGRALTMMSEDFLAAVSPKSRPKFYFEKERPSVHTTWVRKRHSCPFMHRGNWCNFARRTEGIAMFGSLLDETCHNR